MLRLCWWSSIWREENSLQVDVCEVEGEAADVFEVLGPASFDPFEEFGLGGVFDRSVVE